MSEKTSPQPDSLINFQVFDEPSGNIRGFVTGFIRTRKGRRRIAHAHLRTDKPADVTTDLSVRFSVDDLAVALKTLAEFEQKVRELDSPGI